MELMDTHAARRVNDEKLVIFKDPVNQLKGISVGALLFTTSFEIRDCAIERRRTQNQSRGLIRFGNEHKLHYIDRKELIEPAESIKLRIELARV